MRSRDSVLECGGFDTAFVRPSPAGHGWKVAARLRAKAVAPLRSATAVQDAGAAAIANSVPVRP